MRQLLKRVTVGIPRALAYYSFFPLWKEFFVRLGAAVILSGETNRAIIESGIRESVNDACIPIKVMQGHAMALAEKADYIFLPRMVSADGIATFCPKFLGLPDMIRYSGAKLPPLIDVEYNRSGMPGGLWRFFRRAAATIGVTNPARVAYAALAALYRQRLYRNFLQGGRRPPLAIEDVFAADAPALPRPSLPVYAGSPLRGPVVALLGYPYAIFDSFISARICDRLETLGARVFTFEQVPPAEMRRSARLSRQNFFWYFSNQVFWAGLYFLRHKESLDGIIHVTAFGCGPDAMVDKTLELEAKSVSVPYLSLTIDEHTGEGGIQTRLEAFVDMMEARNANNRAG